MLRLGTAIKLSLVLIWAGGAVLGDSRMACPVLAVEQSCSADGQAIITLRPGPKSPPGVSYVISLPDEGTAAQNLPENGSLTFSLPNPKGRQVTMAVVGLEPDGGDLATCCLSNQRVHLPASCAPNSPENPAAQDDLAISLTLSEECERPRAGAICSGLMQISGRQTGLVTTTLSADFGASILVQGVECSPMAAGQALCQLPLGQPVAFDLALRPQAPAGKVQLCTTIGIGSDAAARTLALQDALDRAGYQVGSIDGDFGPTTLAALTQFVADAGLPPLQSDIPPEALALLGLDDFADANPENNRACSVALVPAPPLVCDSKTTRRSGDACQCRFKDMNRLSNTACACPKGTKLGPSGCESPVLGDGDTNTSGTGGNSSADADTGPACDAATTELRNGVCECRNAGMVRLGPTSCGGIETLFCPDGSPQIPGFACPSTGSACARFNAAGECCDDLEADDPSCR